MHQDIIAIWKTYCDGIYNGDVDQLGSAFDGQAHLVTTDDGGKIAAMPIAQYLAVVASRDAPAKSQATRAEQILAITITTPKSALVVAKIDIGGKRFLDQLSLLLTRDGWKIVGKTYQRVAGE